MKDWVVPIAVALAGGFLSGGAVPLIQALRGRGRDQVEAVDVLRHTAREWVIDFKAEALAARSEVSRVRDEAQALANELYRLRVAILAPNATITGLRELVRRGQGPRANRHT